MTVDLRRLRTVLGEELGVLDWRALLARWLMMPLPTGSAHRLRAALLRLGGTSVGEGTVVMGSIAFSGGRGAAANVHIGRRCLINQGCVLDATAPIDIGDEVALGHEVLIVTSAHATGDPRRRAGALRSTPVRVGDGAWIASRAVLLPGVVIGEGAIVAAGAVVTASVPPHTLVGGVPARELKSLPS